MTCMLTRSRSASIQPLVSCEGSIRGPLYSPPCIRGPTANDHLKFTADKNSVIVAELSELHTRNVICTCTYGDMVQSNTFSWLHRSSLICTSVSGLRVSHLYSLGTRIQNHRLCPIHPTYYACTYDNAIRELLCIYECLNDAFKLRTHRRRYLL